MMRYVLTAVAAGCAAGLMFASLLSGAMLSVLLAHLAPVPLMVAALGWGPVSALIGAATAGTGIGLGLGFTYCAVFLVSIGLPAFWLGHLALLAKPAATQGAHGMNGSSPAPADALEWYPPGRLLLWIAAIACLTMAGSLLTLGGDYETITTVLRRGVSRILAAFKDAMPPSEHERLVDTIVLIAPSLATLGSMLSLVFNLWLSGRIVRTSGLLRRPWPDLHRVELPQTAFAALAAALALSFAGGLPGMLAQMASAVLLAAYTLVGLAVLHFFSQRFGGRWWLVGAYACIVLLQWWPLLLVAILGLLDSVIGLRRRYGGALPPPLST
jgi:hypothetical protein